jgi:hypothetical protein
MKVKASTLIFFGVVMLILVGIPYFFIRSDTANYKLGLVKIGMSKDEVKKVLGTPQRRKVAGDKEHAMYLSGYKFIDPTAAEIQLGAKSCMPVEQEVYWYNAFNSSCLILVFKEGKVQRIYKGGT